MSKTNGAKLTGPKKAAMALLSLGEEVSSLILKKLTTEEIKELSVHMSYIDGMKKETSDELLKEFTSLQDRRRAQCGRGPVHPQSAAKLNEGGSGKGYHCQNG